MAIGNARQALLSVLLGFVVVLLAASSLEYLFERVAQPDPFRVDPGCSVVGDRNNDLNRLGREVRPVGRDQYILVQGSPPPSHLPGDFLIPLIRLLPSDLVDATKSTGQASHG